MENIGVFIVGTSPMPVYISIKNYLSDNCGKIILLATENDEFSKGTIVYANRLKEAFYENIVDIEIIDRSNLNIIEKTIKKILETINNTEEKVAVYLDFTGGTKLQSAFIRESFQHNIDMKKDNLTLSYVDGYSKKISLKDVNTLRDRTVCFDTIDGCDEDDNMKEICKLHGYNIDLQENGVYIEDYEQNSFYRFDDVMMKNYNLEFEATLKQTLGKGDDGKAKVKMEMFKFIINSEKIGGSFSELNLIVPSGKEIKYSKLINEFLGIKKNLYKDRISFNGKCF